MKKVCVIFGGMSPEHEISCLSAASVLENIDKTRYEVTALGITKEGRWLFTQPIPDNLKNGSWKEEKHSIPAIFSPSRHQNSGIKIDNTWYKPDCIFPVLHGEYGEDGCIQGLIKLAGIDFVGCPPTPSAICMDKIFTKIICTQQEIAMAEFISATGNDALDIDKIVRSAEENFAYPMFVKPANTGSSVGVSKVYNRDELYNAIKIAFTYDHRILVEEFIEGLELEVAVLGNYEPIVSGVGQIIPSRDFYSYEAKYSDGTSGLEFDPPISKEISDEIRHTAAKIFRLLDCRGLSRVDFFYDTVNSRVVFNEINTIPGFTSISMYPKLFALAGISYSELITRLIELASERG